MKNIYNTGAYQMDEDGFKLNIFYNESSPLNYITPVDGVPFPTTNAKGKTWRNTTFKSV